MLKLGIFTVVATFLLVACAGRPACSPQVWPTDPYGRVDPASLTFISGLRAVGTPDSNDLAVAPCGARGQECRKVVRAIRGLGGKVVQRERCAVVWALPQPEP